MTDIFLHCPCDSSEKLYPENTLADFTMNLSKPIELDSMDYEVGLCEIQFPYSWENIRKNRNKIIITVGYGESWVHEDEIIIQPGYYESIADLVLNVQSQINLRSQPVKANNGSRLHGLFLKYNQFINQVTINAENMSMLGFKDKLISKNLRLTLTGDVANLFGFEENTVIESGTNRKGHRVARADGNFFQMHIYSTIVIPQQHGSKMYPILRTIAISGKRSTQDDFRSITYNPARYYPISSQTITDINFQFRDNNGHLVGFKSGTTYAVLHIRRKKYI